MHYNNGSRTVGWSNLIQQKGRGTMKNIWLLTKTNIKRNLYAIILSVFGAFILSLILFFMGNLVTENTADKVSIGWIDQDQSVLSEDFKDYLNLNMDYDLIEDLSYDQLSSELIEKRISVIIEIPESFYDNMVDGVAKEIIITSLEDYENAAFLQVTINNYMNSVHMLSLSSGGNQDNFNQLLQDYKKEEIKLTQAAAKTIDIKEQKGQVGFINSIGFYMMIIFAISTILAFMILDDRLSGVYRRIQATPVKPIQYIIGSSIFGLLLCFIQILLYSGYITLMDVRIGVPVPVVILMMSLFSIFTISFTIAVALALKSKNAVTSIIIGFSTVGCILGGAYFTLDFAPKTLQDIAKVLPQYWFMDAFRRLQLDLTANIMPNIIIIVLYIVLFILIGAVMFAQNNKYS
jgi:ABC-2 type transport system permease protein